MSSPSSLLKRFLVDRNDTAQKRRLLREPLLADSGIESIECSPERQPISKLHPTGYRCYESAKVHVDLDSYQLHRLAISEVTDRTDMTEQTDKWSQDCTHTERPLAKQLMQMQPFNLLSLPVC